MEGANSRRRHPPETYGEFINKKLETAFYHHGLFVSKYPILIILVTTISAIMISLPGLPLLMGNLNQQGEVRYNLWSSKEQVTTKGFTEVKAPRWVKNIEPSARVLLVFFKRQQSGNVATHPFLRQVGFDVPNQLVTFKMAIDGITYGLDDFCTRGKDYSGCMLHHPGVLWNYNQSLFHVDERLSMIANNHATVNLGVTKDPDVGPEEYLISSQLPSSVLLRNLRVISGFGVSYISADAAVLMISLKPEQSTEMRSIEDEFITSMLASVLPGLSNATQLKTTSPYTYLRYRKTFSTLPDKIYLTFVYALVFFYIYLTVAKFEFVKSKFGLGLAGVAILMFSTMMGIGFCITIGLITTITAVEVLPFLVVAIGLDNVTVITTSIVSKWGLPIRFQVAEGLAKAGPQLIRSLLTMEGLLLLGVYSRIPALQEFCAIGCVSVLFDFILESLVYVAILSLDIRRVELSDFSRAWFMNAAHQAKLSLSEKSTERFQGVGHEKWYSRAERYNLQMMLGLVTTIIIAVLGGIATTERSMGPIPNMLVDWRSFLLHPESADDALIEFLPSRIITTSTLMSASSTAERVGPWNTFVDTVSMLEGSRWVMIAVVAGVFVCVSSVVGLHKYLLFRIFGERIHHRDGGVDPVVAFGSVQNFDVAKFAGHSNDLECLEIISSPPGHRTLFASACLGGEVRVWDNESNRCVEVLSCKPFVNGVEPTTPWCLCGHENFIAVGFEVGIVQIWDLATRVVLRLPPTGPLPGEGEVNPEIDGGAIKCLKFFNNSLVSGSSTGVLQLWTWSYCAKKEAAQAPTHNLVVPECESLPRRNSSVYDLENLSGFVVSDDSALRFVCVKSKAFHKKDIVDIVVSTTYIVTASDDNLVKIFDKDLNVLHSLYGHEAPVTCLKLVDNVLVTGSRDTTCRLWNTTTGSCELALTGHTDTIFRVDVNDYHVASASEDDSVRIWSVATGELTNVLEMSGEIILHSSGILLLAVEGCLTACDLLGRGERLRTIPLLVKGDAARGGFTQTSHLLLDGDKIFCDVGNDIKTVRLPFPLKTHTLLERKQT
eukprot:m.147356 g.147356  ORF g.147356 m.147356 type:complete len:1057 (-) comp30532_c0_seq1:161-3331(-)